VIPSSPLLPCASRDQEFTDRDIQITHRSGKSSAVRPIADGRDAGDPLLAALGIANAIRQAVYGGNGPMPVQVERK
jgi:hypothetical protein